MKREVNECQTRLSVNRTLLVNLDFEILDVDCKIYDSCLDLIDSLTFENPEKFCFFFKVLVEKLAGHTATLRSAALSALHVDVPFVDDVICYLLCRASLNNTFCLICARLFGATMALRR